MDIEPKKRVMTVATKVQKWGNSLGIRIPQSAAKQLGIDNGSELELTMKKDSIILKPVDHKPTLEELCSQITDNIKHDEINFGKPEGEERW